MIKFFNIQLFQLLLFIHIICGAIAFIIGAIVLFFKKGTAIHIKLGIIFFYSLVLSSTISLLMSYLHQNMFLFIVGIFTLYLLIAGKLYIKIKSKKDVTLLNWMVSIIMIIFGSLFIIYGIYKLISNDFFGVVLISFGLISIALTIQDFRNFSNPDLNRNIYLRSHISRMVGGFIAAITAFLVVNNHLLPNIVAWMLPTIILTPLIIKWIKKYAPIK